MKLVVLDGYLAGFDGLRPPLGEEHELVWYDASPPEEIAGRIRDADGVVVNRAELDARTIGECPRLRYLGCLGTGFNMIDLEAATRKGIVVSNAPGYSEAAVAQGTFALLLEIAGGTSRHNHYVHNGGWTSPVDPALTGVEMTELAGKALGIVGLGSIGSAVARIAAAFGMRVAATDSHGRRGERGGIPLLPLEELLAWADVVSLHCPLNSRTRSLIGPRALARMKEGAILLNTARGGLLDEGAVFAALQSGRLAWLGADGLAQEPPLPGNPLATHPRAVITPHVAWMPRETRKRLLNLVGENFLAFAAGRPQNVVNKV